MEEEEKKNSVHAPTLRSGEPPLLETEAQSSGTLPRKIRQPCLSSKADGGIGMSASRWKSFIQGVRGGLAVAPSRS